MKDTSSQHLFVWLDRAFYLIWLGFLVFVVGLVRQVLNAPADLAALAPDQAACLANLPQMTRFSSAGQIVFWGSFAVEMAILAVLLVMAHQVVHRCAIGQVFVAPMITSLQRIGIVIAVYPVIELALQNIGAWAYVQTGDMIAFSGSYTLDAAVIGVGLLLVTLAAAMRMAVRLHEDAALTV